MAYLANCWLLQLWEPGFRWPASKMQSVLLISALGRQRRRIPGAWWPSNLDKLEPQIQWETILWRLRWKANREDGQHFPPVPTDRHPPYMCTQVHTHTITTCPYRQASPIHLCTGKHIHEYNMSLHTDIPHARVYRRAHVHMHSLSLSLSLTHTFLGKRELDFDI